MAVAVIQDVRIIVRVTGEIDLANVSELDHALDDAVTSSPEGFLVDASGLSYIDGTGVRSILGACQRVRDGGGTLALISGEIMSRILDLIGAKGLPCLLISDSVESGMDALSRCTNDG